MKRITAAFLLLLPCAVLQAHPDKVEDRLKVHFATGQHAPENGVWEDMSHTLKAKVMGKPAVKDLGPARALVCNGVTDWLEIAGTMDAARPLLPEKEMTVTAIVRLHETMKDGGICGLLLDTGSREKGWLLGYSKERFTFVLSSTGADDGDGRLTSIGAKEELRTGPWYHVAATYDGTTMRLYVNGRLDAESTAQSGAILYPEEGRFAAAAFVDNNELNPMDGALAEVKVYHRVLPPEEIASAAEKHAGLLAAPSTFNSDALQFVVKPYLQGGTATRMSIMAETSKPSAMTVSWGEVLPFSTETTTAPGLLNAVHLDALKPHTRYFYQVSCDDGAGNTVRSPVGNFQTMPGPDDAWAFGILGDTQRNPGVTRQCAEGIRSLRPNFLLHVGDVVDDGFAKQQWVFDLFAPCADLFATVPVFPAIGNHEKNSPMYYEYFHLPEPEYFYTFTCGNAEYFMVDTNKDCSPAGEQYARLEKALAASTATWKFAAHHHPCFSSDEEYYGDQLKGSPEKPFTAGDTNARHLVALYEKYGVDIVFAGHIHSYERTWPVLNMSINQQKGVRYIISGGGGGGLETAAPQRAWFSLHVKRGHHYCFASVHDRTIQFKAYDLSGNLFDTFELTKPAGER